MMRSLLGLGLGLVLVTGLGLASCAHAPKGSSDLRDAAPLEVRVDPFIGTGGHGHTFPGPTMPFGMVQLSPDTRLDGWDGCSGYHYTDDFIYGFSHTHLSGTGVSDYGDVLVLPTTAEPHGAAPGDEEPRIGSRFRKETENATAWKYSVYLDDEGVECELTALDRTGLHRYTFEEDTLPKIFLDLLHRDRLRDVFIEQVNEYEVRGFRRSQQWAEDQHVYFHMRFSAPIGRAEAAKTDVEGAQKPARMLIALDVDESRTVVVAVGLSPVDMEGAKRNLDADLAAFGVDAIGLANCFDLAVLANHNAWKKQLSKARVEGGTPAQQETFQTALHRTMIAPNLFSDVDGRYRGMEGKIHTTAGHEQYTVFSLWDTYRALHPLHTIIEPERTEDFVQSMLRHFDQGGALPIWELAGNETYCMIGYHAVPVIQDAHEKGLRDAPTELALEAMVSSASAQARGLAEYAEYGYIPSDAEGESVSKTLEYAYDDWCIAEYAREIGRDEVAARFSERAQYYRNLFDPESGFFRAKRNESFMAPFDPAEVNFNFTEANAWQYRFAVPHDLAGLRDLLGGDAAMAKELDALFEAPAETTGRNQADITGLIGQYAHGNEPSHHVAYLYNFVGQPWKTQERVRQIVDTLYSAEPDGLCGNEDCGQMSAWYVFGALGFYPVCPGAGEYWIGTPRFPRATIDVGEGKTFTVVAKQLSDKNLYIQSATLRGEPLEKCFITHEDLLAGGTLEFVLGPEPSTWGAAPEARPTSRVGADRIVAVPYVESGARVFRDETSVVLATIDSDADIFFSTTTRTPDTKYEGPIEISESTELWFEARRGSRVSKRVRAEFDQVAHDWEITLGSEYSNQYTGGGVRGLIDGLRGGGDFRTGGWQGYWDTDLVATIDLGEVKTVGQVHATFLQEQRSWIWVPTEVVVEFSKDGESFSDAVRATPKTGVRHEEATIEKVSLLAREAEARYIRVTAKKRPGGCPDWHLGAGNPSWIFADEIEIEAR